MTQMQKDLKASQGKPKCQDVIDAGNWNLSDEREFMENLLCQRFNFFIVMFSLFLTAAFTAQSRIACTAILGVGAVVSLLVALTVYRAYIKHRWIMKHIYNHHKCHPTTRVNDGVDKYRLFGKVTDKNDRAWRCFTVNWLIGIFVPVLCVSVLGLLAWLSYRGYFILEP